MVPKPFWMLPLCKPTICINILSEEMQIDKHIKFHGETAPKTSKLSTYIEGITRWLECMKFIFSWKKDLHRLECFEN